jgi:hypothetical protein
VRSDFPDRDDSRPVTNMMVKIRDGEWSLRQVAIRE